MTHAAPPSWRNAKFAAVDMDDPAGVHAAVMATPVAPPKGVRAPNGPSAWQAPGRERIRVVVAVRNDVAAKMFARGQIDRACFLAARDYEVLYEVAESSRIPSCDASMPPIQNGRNARDGAIDLQRRARKGLLRAEAIVSRRLGDDAVAMLRAVLGNGQLIERVAQAHGDDDKQGFRFWGSFFRRCLKLLAVVFGYATKHAYGKSFKPLTRAPQ